MIELASAPPSVLDFYTPLEDAVEQLVIRRRSNSLRDTVREETMLTPELASLYDEPHIVLFRQVATPIHEILQVLETAKHIGLKLFILEFGDDKFVGKGNIFKRGLGKMKIHQFTAPGGDDVFENRTVVDFNAMTGKTLDQVTTVQGESLLNFHHELFHDVTGHKASEFAHDGSAWFSQFGHRAETYYRPFFKMFLRDAILAEIFTEDFEKDSFTHQIVLPSFIDVAEEFGMAPLIWHNLSEKEKARTYWDCYPKQVGELLTKKGYI